MLLIVPPVDPLLGFCVPSPVQALALDSVCLAGEVDYAPSARLGAVSLSSGRGGRVWRYRELKTDH